MIYSFNITWKHFIYSLGWTHTPILQEKEVANFYKLNICQLQASTLVYKIAKLAVNESIVLQLGTCQFCRQMFRKNRVIKAMSKMLA